MERSAATRRDAATVPYKHSPPQIVSSKPKPVPYLLSGIYYATGALLRKRGEAAITPPEAQLAVDYWTALAAIIPEWHERIMARARSSARMFVRFEACQ